MNKTYQERGKMEVVNEENEDEEMMDNAMASSSTMPMQASTHLLAAKLKKITDSTPNPVPMVIDTEIKEMDIKDLKKRARAITPIMRPTTTLKNDTQIWSPDGKKTCNDDTPPWLVTAHQSKASPDVTMKETRQATNDKPTRLEEASLQESEKPLEEKIQQAAMTISQEISQQAQAANQAQKAKVPTHHRSDQSATTIQNKALPDESQELEKDNDAQAKTDPKGYSSTQSEQAKSQEQDSTTNQETPAEEQQLQESTEQQNDTLQRRSSVTSITKQTTNQVRLTEISPKEWQKHHDTWLNAVMRNAIGEKNPQGYWTSMHTSRSWSQDQT